MAVDGLFPYFPCALSKEVLTKASGPKVMFSGLCYQSPQIIKVLQKPTSSHRLAWGTAK